jgi:hypothetical protein
MEMKFLKRKERKGKGTGFERDRVQLAMVGTNILINPRIRVAEIRCKLKRGHRKDLHNRRGSCLRLVSEFSDSCAGVWTSSNPPEPSTQRVGQLKQEFS